MPKYKSIYSGPQIDTAVGKALVPDTEVTEDSDALITSGAVFDATEAKANPALSFTITLSSASWISDAQTVSNVAFIASGYSYVVSPASSSFADYAAAQIYADDVTTDGSMTFHCASAPSSNITVNVLRVEVS